ncbi:MAG TPA: DNA methyltransferase [Phycisphaerales bacterium]|nr:DNA methyltransferase [Phycisphaerales bacterium]
MSFLTLPTTLQPGAAFELPLDEWSLILPHPAAGRVPEMTPEEYAELRDSIASSGLLHPLVVHRESETVLDGRHRLRACRELGISPRFVLWEPPDPETPPLLWVLATNAHRRHLTPSQRSLLAAEFATELKRTGARLEIDASVERSAALDGAQANAESSAPQICGALEPGLARRAHHAPEVAAASNAFGVSPRLVEQAETVVEFGVPELVEKVREGGLAVHVAHTIAERPESEQRETLARGDDEVRAEAKRLKAAEQEARRKTALAARATTARQAAPSAPGIDLRCGDIEQALRGLTGAALVIADPPWPYKNRGNRGASAKQYGELRMHEIGEHVRQAHIAALDDTYLLVWCTWPFLREWTIQADTTGWDYLSGGCWGKTGRIGAGFHWRGDSEPLLVYRKGKPQPFRHDLSNLFLSPRTKNHSEKPVEWLCRLIDTFCPPGGLVLDLYAGLAPVARACRETGRRYLGCEIDPARHAAAVALLEGREIDVDLGGAAPGPDDAAPEVSW